MSLRSIWICLLGLLDASGKSGAYWHHRRYRSPRRKTAAGFFVSQYDRPKRFQFVETVSSNFPQFVDRLKTV
jgi:hypothetical protein